MGPIRSPSGESARHEDAQKRLISATAAAQKRRVGGLAYESPAALRGWRSGEQAGTCSAVLGAAGESRERGRGWPPRAAKAKYRTILRRSERKAVSWLWGGAVLRGPGAPSCDMLTHVRAVLSILKFRGHPDLQSTVVSKAQNYWLKITGASEMHTRGVKVFMINGQGRWRLHAQEPGDMVYKYWQSSLLEKIATSNF